MNPLRVLILAPEANPESVSTPTIGYRHSEALARIHSVTLVVRSVNEAAVRKAGGPFVAIEPIPLPWLEPLYEWAVRRIFKYDYGRQSLTAACYPIQLVFEWRAWRRLRNRIKAGDFDVVLRILPGVPVLPSPFAYFLRNGPIPFVIGPLNGGLPWPKGFRQLEKQQQAPGWWVAKLRGFYRYLPFSRSTYSLASAIIAGSSHTYTEFIKYREKLFFVPGENGLPLSVFEQQPRPRSREGVLELIFVGRLIPFKACDLALQATAPLLREGIARLTIVGDGAERATLEELAKSLGIEKAVTFLGWLSTEDSLLQIQRAHVMVFPSLREFGGAVIFEALCSGVVPVVVDFGGPGDIVNPQIGYKVPLTNEADIILQIENALRCLAEDRTRLEILGRQGTAYARDYLTWDGKARIVTEVLMWVTGRAPKPKLLPPDRLASAVG